MRCRTSARAQKPGAGEGAGTERDCSIGLARQRSPKPQVAGSSPVAPVSQKTLKCCKRAARRFALLGEPNRIRIALVLREIGELCVGDTANLLDLKISLVSHHMRAFADQDLAEKRRDGKLVRYRLTPAALQLLELGIPAGAAPGSTAQ